MKRVTKADLKVIQKIGKTKARSRGADIVVSGFKKGIKYHYILQQAEYCYNSLLDVRRRAYRNSRYYRGHQWGDIVVVNGESMTEAEYLQMQGRPPLKQNLIRPHMRNILGQFRSNPYKSVVTARNRKDQTASEMMTVALEGVYNANDGKERDARKLEDFLITSTAIYETSYSFDHERKRSIPKFRSVNLSRFFIDPNIEDVQGEDIGIIGDIEDIPLYDLVARYAKTPEQQIELEKIYASTRDIYNDRGFAFDEKTITNLDFLTPVSSNLCRVIKVCIFEGEWKLLAHDRSDASYETYALEDQQMLDAENESRMLLSQENNVDIPLIEYERKFIKTWKYYHLTPTGFCLWESECLYEHNSHPYIFQFYPMFNGAVWSIVEDLIDQQKMINRSVILWDFMNSASAKGVLLVPEEAITEDFPLERIAEEWVKFNGVVKIKLRTEDGRPVQVPKQIVSSALHPGMVEMISLQMKFLQEISGVSPAMQGKEPPSGTPASLFAQETANASLNILDHLETFASFCKKRDFKMIQLIRQYYTEKHYQGQGNKNISNDAEWYDPDTIRNLDFENQIAKGSDTPTYRMLIDDMLFKMLENKYIGIEAFLENCSLPFSDKLLASIKSQREMLKEGKMPDGLDPQMLQEAQQQLPETSPDRMRDAKRLFYGNK
jgi:hypothetical protein